MGWTSIAMVAGALTSHAQGRGGGAWTTVGGDAQRTASVRTDPKISSASMQKPGFQFLWKRKLDSQPLTQPLLLPNIIAYKGFKALAFVGSASGSVYSVDYDLNRMFWEQKLKTSAPQSAAAACSSGLPAITRATQLVPAVGGRGGGGGGGNRGAGGAVGVQTQPGAPAASRRAGGRTRRGTGSTCGPAGAAAGERGAVPGGQGAAEGAGRQGRKLRTAAVAATTCSRFRPGAWST